MSNFTFYSGGRWCDRADALLDVPGVHITSVTEAVSGPVVHVETDQTLVSCRACGVVVIGHGRRQTPAAGHPVFQPARSAHLGQTTLALPGRTLFHDGVQRGTCAGRETGGPDQPGHSLGHDALERYDTSVSALAHQLGVSWQALWKGVEAEATRRLARPERLAGIDALGVDEHV